MARFDQFDRLAPAEQAQFLDRPAVDEHDGPAVHFQISLVAAVFLEHPEDILCGGLRRPGLRDRLVVDASLQPVRPTGIEDPGHGAVGVVAVAPPAHDESGDVRHLRPAAMLIDHRRIVRVVRAESRVMRALRDVMIGEVDLAPVHVAAGSAGTFGRAIPRIVERQNLPFPVRVPLDFVPHVLVPERSFLPSPKQLPDRLRPLSGT